MDLQLSEVRLFIHYRLYAIIAFVGECFKDIKKKEKSTFNDKSKDFATISYHIRIRKTQILWLW